MSNRPVIWVVSELYYPELTSTGRFLTAVAEGLAATDEVRVLCGQPTYSARGQVAPRNHTRHGVHIMRCRSTTFDKDVLPLRMLNAFTLTSSMVVAALRNFSAGDRVLVVSNPPFVPYVMALACRIKGAGLHLLVHDVYPDLLVATGMVKRNSWLHRLLDSALRWLLGRAQSVIVIGRDMLELLRPRMPAGKQIVTVIPHWADLDVVSPIPRDRNPVASRLGITGELVVLYAGNMGRTHDVDVVVQAARQLRDRSDIRFVFMGSGVRRKWLERVIGEENLLNVTILPTCPEDELAGHLSLADVTVIPVLGSMTGVSVPSRLYNNLAAGSAIIALATEDAETSRVVSEEAVGFVIPPGDAVALAALIESLPGRREDVREMGRRARLVATSKYQRSVLVARYRAALTVPPRLPTSASV